MSRIKDYVVVSVSGHYFDVLPAQWDTIKDAMKNKCGDIITLLEVDGSKALIRTSSIEWAETFSEESYKKFLEIDAIKSKIKDEIVDNNKIPVGI